MLTSVFFGRSVTYPVVPELDSLICNSTLLLRCPRRSRYKDRKASGEGSESVFGISRVSNLPNTPETRPGYM
jgi:hypothetical protein